jgi:hypothetical protein
LTTVTLPGASRAYLSPSAFSIMRLTASGRDLTLCLFTHASSLASILGCSRTCTGVPLPVGGLPRGLFCGCILSCSMMVFVVPQTCLYSKRARAVVARRPGPNSTQKECALWIKLTLNLSLHLQSQHRHRSGSKTALKYDWPNHHQGQVGSGPKGLVLLQPALWQEAELPLSMGRREGLPPRPMLPEQPPRGHSSPLQQPSLVLCPMAAGNH